MQKRRFFARIFDMYFHIIISGGMIQEKRERVFIKERDKEAKRERDHNSEFTEIEGWPARLPICSRFIYNDCVFNVLRTGSQISVFK